MFLFLFAIHFSGLSQNYSWWNDANNWDGYTHWHKYLTLSPAYLGPNALPIPKINNGLIPANAYLKVAADKHFSAGDATQNIFADVFFPLYSDRVGIRLYMVPLEHYQYDTATRDERSSRDFDGTGYAIGDVYVSTIIQLVKEQRYFPDLLLTVNLKTASGNKLSAARFTDTPAYFFDISFGKSIKPIKNSKTSIRPYFLSGFYVWQTFDDDYFQNDAFLYGLGFDLTFPRFTVANSFGSYKGYIGNGDHPSVYRINLTTNFESKLNGELMYQQGFHDNQYSSLRLAIRWLFN